MNLKQEFRNFWEILSHPMKSYRKIRDYDNLTFQRDNLQKDLGYLVEDNYELTERVEDLRESFQQTRQNYLNLKSQIPVIRDRVAQVLRCCVDIKTGRDVIEARVKENESSTTALENWKTGYAVPLERRMQAAEKQTAFLKDNSYGIATDVAIKTVVELDPRIKKVPFIFYNSVTKQLTYTPETLKFFKIKEEEAESFNLRKLLRQVDSQFLKGSNGILAALNAGEKLSHYDAKTCGENPIDLKLTTYPVKYGHNNLGIGILLYDPKVSLKSVKNRNLIKSLDGIFHNVAEELNMRFFELSQKGKFGIA